MNLSITDRTLLKMIFLRGKIREISGICDVGNYKQLWTVRHHPVTPIRAEAFFTATVTGIYGKTVDAPSLEECLDKLEAMIAEA
ncbi:MAG: hypothetical protein J6V52_01710 [Bacteroidaceae bacterium]|nr:hypothetical protein [Bacteroidaceae bacterium]